MAELLLKIRPGSGYEDGDILCAFNRRRILHVHAQHICHVRKAKRNGSGLILPSEPCHDWYERTHQYRFERVSASEIIRTEIATGIEERFGQPNIDVRLFIRRRKQRADHHLFGEDGREIWYGGRIDMSAAAADRVWEAIEQKTPHSRGKPEFARWPMGRLDVRHHLPIAVDEFGDAEGEELVAAEVDDTDPENPVVVAKRRNRIEIETGLGMSTADLVRVRDPNTEFDLRGRGPFRRAAIVKRKQRPTPGPNNRNR